jgi:plasmid maintenance system killer protein
LEVELSAKLQKSIGDEAQHLKKEAGQLSKPIKLRIDQIRAAANYLQYQSIGLGKPHLLDGDFAGCFAVNVSNNYRLIGRLCVEDVSPESLEKCDKVVLEGVVDYHGKSNNWIIP